VADLVMLDTSVLVQATFGDLPHHRAVWAQLERARGGPGFAVSCHSLAELAWIASDGRLVVAPDEPLTVRRKLEEFLGARFLRKLEVTPRTLRLQAELIGRHALTGPRTLDGLIVASMIENGIDVLHTMDPDDFRVFPDIHAACPYV